MKISNLANNLEKIGELKNSIDGIFEKINKKNHLMNLLFIIPTLLLFMIPLFILLEIDTVELFDNIFFKTIISVTILINAVIMAETIFNKNFFTNKIMNNVKGSFYRKCDNNENFLLKKINNNGSIDLKSQIMINNYFDKLTDIEKEILNVGSLSHVEFNMYDHNILYYLEEYMECHEVDDLKANKDNIFKLIDFIKDEEVQAELINIYMLKAEGKINITYNSKIINEANNVIENSRKIMVNKVRQI